jgi:threonine aldolase
MRTIDLRSDTVTKPSAGMREAMARAEVGDDVLDGDPTMRALEERVAGLTGHEAALWMPTGSMSNLVALMIHLVRGDSFIASAHTHVLDSELGTAASLAQGMPVTLPWSDLAGLPDAEDVSRAASAVGPYYSLRPALLCLENTHNAAGGSVVPVERQREVVLAARSAGLAVHLDGARVWHAAAALGCSVSELTSQADTVSVCLSKGLGVPVGSVLAGTAETMVRARRLRKMLGGGVRQGGVLAAAGLHALDHHLAEIDNDRLLALRLAAGLTDAGFSIVPPTSNIVLVRSKDALETTRLLRESGVLASTMAGNVRFVTHRDVREEDVDEVLGRLAEHRVREGELVN